VKEFMQDVSIKYHPIHNKSSYLLNQYQSWIYDIIKCAQENEVYDKMLLLVGPGRNGKTTFLKEIEEYIGGPSYCCHSISHHHDEDQHLDSKKLFILDGFVNDLSNEDVTYLSTVLDLHKINVIGTTNNLALVHPSILKRCNIIRIYTTFQ
jgi:ATP-dependent Lon protease